MKKYMAVWGALFFCVICLSLYLMLETLNTSPARYNDIDAESVLNFEKKIDGIEEDIKRNQEIINQIKSAVKDVSKGDEESLGKLQNILNSQNQKLQANKDQLDKLQNADTGKKTTRLKEQHGANVVQMEQPKGQKTAGAPLRKEVSVADNMCSWTESPMKKPDIEMEQVMKQLPFDNPDGGAWKQGWKVEYVANHWNAGNKLNVFVVPHSHNDPGWVKTYDRYYEDQTRHIFNNMLSKLEQYPNLKFMYAEISFFHIWWNEINEDRRKRVKKLIDAGRLEIITGGWVMNDEANTHYFAMLDQLLEGHQWLDGTLGVKPTAGWAIDPFGHTPTMAYLLRRSGLNNMLIQRVHYAVKKYLAKNRNLEFMWRQTWDHDGNTDMFCHMMPFYSYDVPHTCGPEPAVCCQFDFRRLPGSSYSCPWKIPPQAISDANVAQRANMIIDQWKKKATLYRSNSLFAPLGDDFRYDKEDEWDLQYINYQKLFEYINSHPELGVQAQFGTLSDYFNSIYKEFDTKPGQKPDPIKTLTGDFYTYADKDDHYWSGYFTSRPFQKNLDRVMESHLRAAEILFSLATATARRKGHLNLPQTVFMDKMIQARRNLGLFQHHDGITGTAKDFVVVDYGNRLLKSLQDTKLIIKECATYLTLDTKTEYSFSENAPWFNVDETRVAHDLLPEKSVIQLGEETDGTPRYTIFTHLQDYLIRREAIHTANRKLMVLTKFPFVSEILSREGHSRSRPVMFYNSFAQSREQVVKIYVSCADVIVKNQQGVSVLSQVEPYWDEENTISKTKFKVSFRLTVPALGIVRYTVQRVAANSNSMNVPVSVLIFNSDNSATLQSHPFSIAKAMGSDITLENPYLKATFAGSNGLLKSVVTKENGVEHSTKLEFVTYGTKPHSGDRSGAYLFLPDGPARPYTSQSPPVVNIIQGPIVSEVHVYFELVTHVVRLYNSSGIDGISLDMQNIVDITTQRNVEIAVRIHTDVQNKDNEFYTDLNGFQMQKHTTYDKLTVQGNVYPMPTMAFIEDDKHRFSILSANSLGFSNLKPGMMDVFLDRRLNQDDSRGLGQGVTDSKQTPSRFKLLLENRHKGTYNKDRATNFASLLGHQTSLQLIHPVFVIPAHNKHSSSFPRQSDFSPMHSELPCDVHLLNLRTMQNKDDGPDRLVPKSTAAMFFHRLGIDCGFPNKGLMCKGASGEVVLSGMFNEILTNVAQQVSLTLMYEEQELDTTELLDLEPMEIASFVVTLQ
ncbi:alpha-mannosidase 2x-like [Mercenaria mercenaria]|uniref:alpha-mannosidase 2x-like n=1 Tax=Mercenaria mercenaria TaxID=6596 RepID=UPI00234EC74C|nr:alpha-mannosidase 2x-like [Mercenaria mercenaria]